MRVVVASVIGLALAVSASAQESSPPRAWVPVPGANQALGAGSSAYGYASVPLADGRVVVSGGEDENGNIMSAAAVFDGLRSWSATTPMNTPRVYHAMARLNDGRVMAIGGVRSWNDVTINYACTGGPLSSFEVYNPADARWTPGASSMTTGRYEASAATLPDGRVLVAGGYGLVPSSFSYGPPCTYGYLSTAELYDPTTNSWTPSTMHQSVVSTVPLLALGDGRVVAYTEDNSEIYDPTTNTWSAFVLPHHNPMIAVVLPDGRLFTAGAYDAAGFDQNGNPIFGSYTPTATIFDPRTNTWHETAPLPRLTVAGGAVVPPDGTVLVGGGGFFDCGYDASHACNTQLNLDFGPTTYVYDPVADKWSNGPASQLLDANGSSFAWASNFMMQVGPGRLLLLNPYGGAVNAVFRVVTPPTPVAGSPSFPGLAGLIAQYPLDASASFDADGDAIVQYTWSESGNVLATSATPTATLMLSGGQTHNLTLTVTDATTQTGSTPVTVTIADPTQQLQTELAAAQANAISLQSQLTTVNTALAAAYSDITALKAQLAAVASQLASVQTLLAAALGDPGFTLPGATVQAQMQNLAMAIQQLNPGQQQALYKNLGGKK